MIIAPRLGWHRPIVTLGLAAVCSVALWGCGGGSVNDPPVPLTVPKATCGPNDTPESALQGQVPAALRASGFKGFSCNLAIVGQAKGEGASWQHAWFQDKAGHKCNYYDTSSPVNNTADRTHLGTVVVDTSNPSSPTPTSYLTTQAMLDPWESLKVNERRQLLGAEDGTNAAGTGYLDLYDISADCRNPQLLSTVETGTAKNGDAAALPAGQILAGHEGNFAPDGLTWYSGDRGTPKKYTATDISDATHPRLIATWTLPQLTPTTVTTHGLTVSDDGNRAYVSQAGVLGSTVNLLTAPPANGVLILDTSDVQKRLPNAQIRQVGSILWRDGGQMQHTIPITVNGKNYLVAVEESSTGGNSMTGYQAACAAGLPPFNMARIIDISDETNPKVTSRLMLETHDPANCSKVLPDLVGLSSFTYGSHYCSVDNRLNATTLACGYFNSGIRVFDIRDPVRPKEIAYFNPAGTTTPSQGSNHYQRSGPWVAGGPDWCNAQIRLDVATASLQTTCQDNGFLALKFTNGVWPFPTSTTPPGLQN
jgi:LVIVD repeat